MPYIFIVFTSGRQPKLMYNKGRMYFKYTSGAKCENGTKEEPNYQFHVVLYCDYTPDASPISIISYVSIRLFVPKRMFINYFFSIANCRLTARAPSI